jgi:hypothetical protein
MLHCRQIPSPVSAFAFQMVECALDRKEMLPCSHPFHEAALKEFVADRADHAAETQFGTLLFKRVEETS